MRLEELSKWFVWVSPWISCNGRNRKENHLRNIELINFNEVATQQTPNVETTSYKRRCDASTSHRRYSTLFQCVASTGLCQHLHLLLTRTIGTIASFTKRNITQTDNSGKTYAYMKDCKYLLSYDVGSESEITPCIKTDKSHVV